MRVALDTGILAYAVNRYAPEHHRATAVVEQLVNGSLPWALPWVALHEFFRLVTHPHAVARPLSPEEALGFVERVCSSPSIWMLAPTPRHAHALADVTRMMQSHGEPPTGLEIAAILREHGIRELLSSDPGMRRFPFLTVVDPLHGEPWSPGARPARRYRILRAGPATG